MSFIPRPPFEDIANCIMQDLPKGARFLTDEFKEYLKLALKSTLDRLDLVTREEFDIQKAILFKTREKLSELEAVVDQLTKQAASSDTTPDQV